jgi:hypothetical protein
VIGVSRIEPEKRIARFMTVYSKRVARFITVCEVGIKYSFKQEAENPTDRTKHT